MSKTTERLKKAMLTAPGLQGPPTAKDFVSTGSTLLNLCCTDRANCGLAKGGYYHFVGDSGSGKTWVALTVFAEANINKNFADYAFVHDDLEGGAIMDKERFFGKQCAARIQAPPVTNGLGHSVTIEDFYAGLERLFRAGKPFIYVLDSESALDSEANMKKSSTDNAKRAKIDEDDDGKLKGSYGDGKAKIHSQNIRRVVAKLRKTGSILIVVSQTRDNIGFGAKFNPKVYSGGRALKFYANLQIWFAVKGQIWSGEIRGRKRQTGITMGAHVKKNRVSGKDRWVEVPIYHSFGIDDIGACVDYLVEEKTWAVSDNGIIDGGSFGSGRREKLVQKIQEGNLKKALRLEVAETWAAIEEACKIDRVSEYR